MAESSPADWTDETRFRRKAGLVGSEFGDSRVLLDLDRGFYYSLDDIATRIWELLDEEKTLAQLVETLVAEYEVDRDPCAADTRGFLAQLIGVGLVEVA